MRPENRITPAAGGLDEPNRLHGYAAVFNSESEVLYDAEVCRGPFVEVIRPGAFSRSLRDHPDVRALDNHDSSAVLARTKSGTMTLFEDEIGLHFDLILPDTRHGRDVRESVRRKDTDGCSFGMFVIEDTLESRPGLPALRTIIEAHVFEITPACTFPAYSATEVALRSRRNGTPTPMPSTPILAMGRARLRLSAD